MEAVKKPRRGQAKRKTRAQRQAQEQEQETASLGVETAASVAFSLREGADETGAVGNAVPGDAEVIAALSGAQESTDGVDDGSDEALLDDEIAENEETLLAMLGGSVIDDVALSGVGRSANAVVEELLVAEASGSYPSNNGRGHDHETAHAAALAVSSAANDQAVDADDRADDHRVGDVTDDVQVQDAQELEPSPSTISAEPSAPSFDMDDEYVLDHPDFDRFETLSSAGTVDVMPDSSVRPSFHGEGDAAVGTETGVADVSPISPVQTSNDGELELKSDSTVPVSVKPQDRGNEQLRIDTPTQEAAMVSSPIARPSAPHAFHTVEVISHDVVGDQRDDAMAPSAPPEFDTDEEDHVVREGVAGVHASAPSLSPTSSKLLRHVVTVSNPGQLERVSRMTARTRSDITVANATAAVRNSLANSRTTESQRAGIYPSVPVTGNDSRQKTEARHATIARSETGKESYESLLKKQPVRVNLEPFVNFEMNLLRAEASQKREEMKMRHIETNKGELFARLERYLFSEYILHSAAASLEGKKKAIDTLVTKGTLVRCVVERM